MNTPSATLAPIPVYRALPRNAQLAQLCWNTTSGDDLFVGVTVDLDTGRVTLDKYQVCERSNIDYSCSRTLEFQAPGQGMVSFDVYPEEGTNDWCVVPGELLKLQAIDAGAVLDHLAAPSAQPVTGIGSAPKAWLLNMTDAPPGEAMPWLYLDGKLAYFALERLNRQSSTAKATLEPLFTSTAKVLCALADELLVESGYQAMPLEPTDEIIRSMLAVDSPATYRDYLRHPANGEGSVKTTEAAIAKEVKTYKAALAAVLRTLRQTEQVNDKAYGEVLKNYVAP